MTVVDLDAPRARSANVVGAKAARLARAKAAGFPVAAGFVVEAGPGSHLVASLADDVERTGPHAASLELMERVGASVDLAPALARAEALGTSLVARSSSVVEDDARWSGALSSYLDVAPEQLATAVAGCWASTLTPSVLDLCRLTGQSPAAVCPAVLVQSMLSPEAAGTAVHRPGAPVTIVAVWGSPAPLLAGWAPGWAATIEGSVVEGPAVGGPGPGDGGGQPISQPIPRAWLLAVATMAQHVLDGAAAAIEWAVVDGSPVLLQCRPAAGSPGHGVARREEHGAARREEHGAARREEHGAARPADPPAFGGSAADPRALAVADAAIRYAGPLGDRAVLPWLLAGEGAAPLGAGPGHASASAAPAAPAGDARRSDRLAAAGDADQVLAAAVSLSAQALGCNPADVAARSAAVLGRVAGGDLEALGELRPVPPGAGAPVLGALSALADELVAAGVLAHPEQLWSLSPQEVGPLLERPRPAAWEPHRQRTMRWQPFVQAVVAAQGTVRAGDGVSPGAGAGTARRLAEVADLRRVVPGDVVVLRRPSPQLAPALWVAAGLVAESGSGAAHLVEVARSLRVPAVVAVGDLDVDEGELVLVDGDRGDVAVLGRTGSAARGR